MRREPALIVALLRVLLLGAGAVGLALRPDVVTVDTLGAWYVVVEAISTLVLRQTVTSPRAAARLSRYAGAKPRSYPDW